MTRSRSTTSPKSTTFGNPILDGYTQGVFRSLEAEDRIFRSMALQRSLAEQLALNGGKMTDEIALQAVHDAEVATFQDHGACPNSRRGAKSRIKKYPKVKQRSKRDRPVHPYPRQRGQPGGGVFPARLPQVRRTTW
jgi:hypothetical protein